jgi:glutaredoxin
VTPKTVTVYTKPGCPFCAAAKKHYADMAVPFEEIDVKSNPGAVQTVLKLTGGVRAVPVVIEDGQLMIGFGGS